MNKILIVLMCLMFVGCTANKSDVKDNTDKINVLISESANLTEITDNSTVVPDVIKEVTAVAEFRNIAYTVNGNQIILSGSLFDSSSNDPMNGATIKILCHNVIQYNVVVKDNGSFSIVLEDNKCEAGDKAWAEIYFKGTIYQSASITIPGLESTGRSGGGGGSGGSFSTNSVVSGNCSDGIQNQDETGIDCGGICPACTQDNSTSEATCSDGLQNQDETGVDCGGVCPACLTQEPTPTPTESPIEGTETCDDKIQNQDETGVDCGGSCPACDEQESPKDPVETCEDGIQNQDETGIDCGGVCPACSTEEPTPTPTESPTEGTETCDDKIQNQDETGVDCGGICPACDEKESPKDPVETCDDGIQNQDETGVDCGGKICDACQEITATFRQEVPEFTAITAGLALAGVGIYFLKRK